MKNSHFVNPNPFSAPHTTRKQIHVWKCSRTCSSLVPLHFIFSSFFPPPPPHHRVLLPRSTAAVCRLPLRRRYTPFYNISRRKTPFPHWLICCHFNLGSVHIAPPFICNIQHLSCEDDKIPTGNMLSYFQSRKIKITRGSVKFFFWYIATYK